MDSFRYTPYLLVKNSPVVFIEKVFGFSKQIF